MNSEEKLELIAKVMRNHLNEDYEMVLLDENLGDVAETYHLILRFCISNEDDSDFKRWATCND